MKIPVTFLLLLVCVACTPTTRTSSSTIFAQIRGSAEFPYVASEHSSATDAVLSIVAKHISTGSKLKTEVRLKRLSTIDWEERAATREFRERVGVEFSMSFGQEVDGVKRFDDRANPLVQFFRDQSGTEGAFEYEAVWRRKH